jgi:hypothetical protein
MSNESGGGRNRVCIDPRTATANSKQKHNETRFRFQPLCLFLHQLKPNIGPCSATHGFVYTINKLKRDYVRVDQVH